ncbi:hypothetical protein [Allomuricauda sp. R78024]|uniref:hypothetical protein n=1 Tax=Allomuricauda sp. R78024 TaxID=3093867 RepID=UPI0037C662F5
MSQFIQRKPSELSRKERSQVKALFERYYPTVNDKYISHRLSSAYGFNIVLLKSHGIVLGASYYKMDRLKTPFLTKRIPVVQFGQVLKNKYYQGGVIWRTGHWYAQKNISHYYCIKRTVGLSMISSPKVFEHFTKLFKNHCPNLGPTESGKSISIADFLQNIYGKRGVELKFGTKHCLALLDYEPIDITDKWERYYKSKDESINTFFIDNEIIKLKGNRIYDNNIALIVCGYRNPWSFMAKEGVKIQI